MRYIMQKFKFLFFSLLMLCLVVLTFMVTNYFYFNLVSTEYTPDYKLPGRIDIMDGRKIHLIEKGNGTPLVLIPDLGFSAEAYMPLIDKLAANYHVYAFDLIGQGYTDKPAYLSYNQQDYDRFLNKTFQFFHLSKPSIIVQGNAGFILSSFQKNYPGKVNRLIFLDHFPHQPTLFFPSEYLLRPFIGEALVSLINTTILERFIRNPGYYNPLILDNKTLAVLVKYWGVPGTRQAYLKTMRYILRNHSESGTTVNPRNLYLYSERFLDYFSGDKPSVPSRHIILPRCGYFFYRENVNSISHYLVRYI